MSESSIQVSKQTVRKRIWDLLERQNVAPNGSRGRIPSFEGSDAAAELLSKHAAWKESSVIKAVPDRAQQPVRARALDEGKHLYMAAPKLASVKPFYFIDPNSLSIPAWEVADRRKAIEYAHPVEVAEMPPVDMIVCGSVAVNTQGIRLGKGAGYSDIEVALLQEANLIPADTLIVTTVHELQVVEQQLPECEHDFRVDLIVTPERVIECPSHRRPPGIIWESLTPQMISAIPVLANRNLQESDNCRFS
ncbi:5-formyltetrahydrofolate cyclo-ligase [Streptomyces pacificus]|uniref:5-formyltetrahydrofolate cyclo-ligase n=1 Tax=Streptomyces pacificus TaxID=2705029 RepID=A0A6A0ATT8_9ACTN|nr:5-formyltetrahydrofolate cyclo-ligase [Streptomyces pacificus]GFH35027.1 5-formyltetrahydrofolate cyclo-ligase [Streptomyces pacificus]